jgi:rare lipoprotein A
MRQIFLAALAVAALPSCSPVLGTAKAGFHTARFAGRAAWEVGKAGTTIATAPLRVGRGRSSQSEGGGSYRVQGRSYRVLTREQAQHFEQTGIASYYSGGRTANGEPVDSRALTAAHPSLPFGTRVRVTNLANRRSVTVRINDRGPFKDGRIIDLTKRGADSLGFRKQGLTKVHIETR